MPRILRSAAPAALLLLGAAASVYSALGPTSLAYAQVSPPNVTGADSDLQAICQPAMAQSIADKLSSSKVTVKQIGNGPFGNATRFVPASGTLPAYCQVTGNFVTNAKTGKTANFLATFPANWNGKYLQLGCSGHCGQFYVSNPATPSITVTAQGYAGQIIAKGYAAFATDEGHEGLGGADWALTKDGKVDADYVDDFLYRADEVMAHMGKEFTTAFYGALTGKPQSLSHAYFEGCSGGGRDAMVAAAYFPSAFDGIIAGSAYNPMGVTLHGSAIALAARRSPGADITPALLSLMDGIVKAQCDASDGVKDGIVQNPAACNFRPQRDLPHCAGDVAGSACFTKAQIETISTILTAVTDEHGNIVQPGYSVSELQVTTAGLAGLSDPVQKIIVHKNDPNFSVASNYTFTEGGPGPVTAFHAVVPSAEVAAVKAALRTGVGHLPENAGRLLNSKTKLLIWHNFSDERLSPYISINYYKQLAKMSGGYKTLQKQARLFMLPGTGHCSIVSVGPNSFDALAAMENWVEKGQAPEALLATVADRQFSPGAPKAAALKFPDWTAKLCKFPEMAHYSGQGDVRDAANWSCPAGDTSLLNVGESGRQAGVME